MFSFKLHCVLTKQFTNAFLGNACSEWSEKDWNWLTSVRNFSSPWNNWRKNGYFYDLYTYHRAHLHATHDLFVVDLYLLYKKCNWRGLSNGSCEFTAHLIPFFLFLYYHNKWIIDQPYYSTIVLCFSYFLKYLLVCYNSIQLLN